MRSKLPIFIKSILLIYFIGKILNDFLTLTRLVPIEKPSLINTSLHGLYMDYIKKECSTHSDDSKLYNTPYTQSS